MLKIQQQTCDLYSVEVVDFQLLFAAFRAPLEPRPKDQQRKHFNYIYKMQI